MCRFDTRRLCQKVVTPEGCVNDHSRIDALLPRARLFNAATAQAAVTGAGIREEALRIAGCFDSVSVCLSKGLGAPVGSVLCGSREFIGRAHRIRKMAGGGMRQAGILAAEGSYALDHHLERLAQDHFLAQRLTDLLDVDAAGIDRAIAAMNAFFTA